MGAILDGSPHASIRDWDAGMCDLIASARGSFGTLRAITPHCLAIAVGCALTTEIANQKLTNSLTRGGIRQYEAGSKGQEIRTKRHNAAQASTG
jgi:hypothetical protein